MKMFTDEILEKIYSQEEIQKIPISYVVTVVSIVEIVLEEEEKNNGDKF
jgi:hypothetical protein